MIQLVQLAQLLQLVQLNQLNSTTSPGYAITHPGVHHTDDIFATVILSKIFQPLYICRTCTIPANLSNKVIVFDIGCGEFDHHQPGGNGARKNGIPYSSVGLIWKKFGLQLVSQTLDPQQVWEIIDKSLIQGIDALDNGLLPYEEVHCMSISQVISSFNPTWDCSESTDDTFLKAVAFAEVVFDNTFKNAIAKVNAQGCISELIKAHDSPILVLPQFMPWQKTLSTSYEGKHIKFVVYPSDRGGYNWHCVRKNRFENRKEVPKSWLGLYGKDLQKETGIPTATFCHPKGFIGGAETLEDAIALAELALIS